MLTLTAGEAAFNLPGGYLDESGRRHRELVLRPLSGYEEELLALNRDAPRSRLLSLLLTRCALRIGEIAPVSAGIMRDLTVADRLYALLMLRVVTFGRHFTAVITCADCHTRMNVDFDADDVPVRSLPEIAATYRVSLPDGDVLLRLPNGGDQEALEPLLNAGADDESMHHLLARCVLRIGTEEHPTADYFAQLDTSVRRALEAQLVELAPGIDLTMDGVCAACGHAFAVQFDLLDFVLRELMMGTGTLYQEVHYLAYHYHWSESEIMNMTRHKRRRYIELLSDHIEATYGV